MLRKGRIVLMCLLIAMSYQLSGQIMIRQIEAVYVWKEKGTVISDEEFQSYKGVYKFHSHKKVENGKDTLFISPPDAARLRYEKERKDSFANLKGTSLKDFSATDLYGNRIDTKVLDNEVIVLNFWFVACPPCKKEMPELNELVVDFPEVNFIALSLDTPDLLGKFLASSSFDYEIVPKAKEIADLYNVFVYPSHVVIDKNGNIHYVSTSYREGSVDELRAAIKEVSDG